MNESFKLQILTPSKKFYSGEVEQVIVTTPVGKEGFMANHEWTCKILDAGLLKIKECGAADDEWLIASAAGGFLDMKEETVVYIDAIEWDKGPEKRKSRIIQKEDKKNK